MRADQPHACRSVQRKPAQALLVRQAQRAIDLHHRLAGAQPRRAPPLRLAHLAAIE